MASPPRAQAASFRVLVYSEVTNFRHDSIPAGVEAIKKLGAENGFEVEATDDSAVFNDTDLARFQAVVFNNTNSAPGSEDLLNADERAALQKYVRAGGGWVGLHAASASERDWGWYEGLVGAVFDRHPAVQTGRIKVLDHAHPCTKGLPDLWERTEEWYDWRTDPTSKVHTLAQIKPAPLTVDFSSAGSGLPDGRPVPYAWDFDGNGTTDSTDAHPSYTYRTKGLVTARLTVTGPGGLTAQAVQDITVGNTRPEVAIKQPPNGGVFSFGDTIPFTVGVKDKEDGKDGPIDCSRVVVQSQLGHDTHLHPLDNYTGCTGEIVTDAGDSHGPGQNLYYGITAQYEDKGAPGAPALTGSTSLALRTAFREAEHFTATGGTHGGAVIGSRADASGGKRLTEIEDGDWISFDPVNLKNIDSVTVGAASGGIGGSVEFRSGSPTGPLLGRVTVPHTGDWGKVVSPTTALTDPGDSVTLYAVFSNPEWSSDKADLFAVDWLHFNGPGVEKRPGTNVTVKAAPTTGAAPLPVTLSSAVQPVAGRTVSSYHWDFGDNT